MSFDAQMKMKEFVVESERDRKPAGRRERIATAALQGMLAGGFVEFVGNFTSNDQIAHKARTLADALIAELDREKGE